MRGSFGGNHGGNMLRTLSRTVQEPFSSPTGRYYSWRSSSVDDVEWVCVDDDDAAHGFDDFVLGPVPCRLEAQSALTALQQVRLWWRDGLSGRERDGSDCVFGLSGCTYGGLVFVLADLDNVVVAVSWRGGVVPSCCSAAAEELLPGWTGCAAANRR
ncbi:hypothetical protein QQ045_006112 [Rhodiola kirilowii]